jgi:hypothetical protein
MIYDFLLVSIGWAVTLKSGALSGRFATNDKLKRVFVALFWLLPGLTWLLSGVHASYETTARAHALILFCIICIASLSLAKIFKQPDTKNA